MVEDQGSLIVLNPDLIHNANFWGASFAFFMANSSAACNYACFQDEVLLALD